MAVDDVPDGVTNAQLRTAVADCGEVQSIYSKCSANGARTTFVQFKTGSRTLTEAVKARRFKAQTWRVRWDRPTRRETQAHRRAAGRVAQIHLAGVPRTVRWWDVKDVLRQHNVAASYVYFSRGGTVVDVPAASVAKTRAALKDGITVRGTASGGRTSWTMRLLDTRAKPRGQQQRRRQHDSSKRSTRTTGNGDNV